MLAENVMVTDLTIAHEGERVCDVLEKMRSAHLRMLPVVDDKRAVVGVVSTFSVLEHIVPEYIVSGDLKQISYAPDMGILHQHYHEVSEKTVTSVMDKKPLQVGCKESLLSIAAALVAFGKHEYALVIDGDKRLVGIISAGDVLDRLANMAIGYENDA